jgi:hypothetical protein
MQKKGIYSTLTLTHWIYFLFRQISRRNSAELIVNKKDRKKENRFSQFFPPAESSTRLFRGRQRSLRGRRGPAGARAATNFPAVQAPLGSLSPRAPEWSAKTFFFLLSPQRGARRRGSSSGTDAMILKIFSPKNSAKKLAFLAQNKAKFCKKLIITLGFEKNANFFAENGRKLQKIVIITSAPGRRQRFPRSAAARHFFFSKKLDDNFSSKKLDDILY